MSTQEGIAALAAIDRWSDEELACLCVALLEGNGGTLAEDELQRQGSAVRRTLLDARVTLGMWELVRRGEVDLSVTADGEVAIHRRATPRPSVAAMAEALAARTEDDA